MKYRYLCLLAILIIVGCQAGVNKDLSDNQIRELAWNALDESTKSTIVGSKEDILYEESESGISTVINNAPADVWKQAEIVYLNENQIFGIAERLKAKNISNAVARVSFKTLLGESLDLPYEPIRVYIDAIDRKVIGKENGKLNSEIFITSPTAEDFLYEFSNANIFMFEDTIYKAGVPWVDALVLTKKEIVTEIVKQTDVAKDFVNGTANKLPVGTKIYSANERRDILIAETDAGDMKFLGIVEG